MENRVTTKVSIFASFKSEILHEFRDILRREVDKIRVSPAASPEAQRTYEREPGTYSGETLPESPQPPQISFREVTKTVPSFNGYNIPLSQFIRAYRRAREIVPASAEISLTKILINKLRGHAYYAVEDEPCETISQLADLLNGALAPKRRRPMQWQISQYTVTSGRLHDSFLSWGDFRHHHKVR